MRYRQLLFLLLCLCSYSISVSGQVNPKKAGEYFLKKNNFSAALPYYLEYQKQKPNDIKTKYAIGVCYFKLGEHNKAGQFFQFLSTQKKPYKDVFYYLGKTQQHKLDYDGAIKSFKKYLAESKSSDRLRAELKTEIKRCVAGKRIKFAPKYALVQSLGDEVNTEEDEFAPILSPNNQKSLYFASNAIQNPKSVINDLGIRETVGERHTDIYVVQLRDGEWKGTATMNELYNGPYHDAVGAFSSDGSTMYVSKGDRPNGGLYYVYNYSKIQSDDFELEKYPLPASGGSMHGIQLFNDTIMLFTADLPGGYGGYDLYYSVMTSEGQWSPPVNMGNTINTEYNEKAPFLTKNGKTLFFSSNNLNGLGGYDIFRATFNSTSALWERPINMGLPINSAGDEIHFHLAKDGLRALFSSDRIGGKGGLDLYIAFFKEYISEHLTTSRPPAFFHVKASDEALVEQENKPKAIDPASIVTYKLQPLFFDETGVTLSGANQSKVRKVAKMLVANPAIKLTLASHTADVGPLNFNMYSSLQRAQEIANFMISEGVQATQIKLMGCGPNFPLALNKNAQGQVLDLGQKLNNRLDFYFFNHEDEPVSIDYRTPVVAANMRDPKSKHSEKLFNGLAYKVEIKVMNQMYDGDVLTSVPFTLIEAVPGNPQKRYTVGLTGFFSEANRIGRTMKSKGFKNARVIAYVNGKRINKAEVADLTSLYSDLYYYRDYLKLEEASKSVDNGN